MIRARPVAYIIFIFVAFLMKPGCVEASQTWPLLKISADVHSIHLAPWVEILEDPDGTLSLDTASARSDFSPNTFDTFNFGVTSSIYWLRFSLAASSDDPKRKPQIRILDLGEAFPGRVRWSLFNAADKTLLASGGTRGKQGGIVKLALSYQPRTYYLRISSSTGLILQPRLFSLEGHFSHFRVVNLWVGLFYGIILAVAVYNLFLYFSFNDRSYLWYVLHLVFVALYFLGINGLSGALLLKGKPELLGMFNRSFLGFMIASIVLLTRSFLMIRQESPHIDRLLRVVLIIACVMVVNNFFLPARMVNIFLVIMGILVPSIMVYASWYSLASGFKPARLFMMAWAFFIIGVVSFALTVGGAIPFTAIGFNGFQIGAALAATLLSLALGNRIRALRKERASLKENMERVTMILDSIESGVFLIENKTRRIQEINRAAEKIVGQNREDIVGKYCWQFIRSAVKTDCPIADKCQCEDCREDILIRPTGEEIPVFKRAKLIDLSGHRLILESFVDISDLKKAEEAVRRSEAKFRSLFESSRDAVVIVDKDRFIDGNRAALEMFGCTSAQEFLGKTPATFSPTLQPSQRDSATEAQKLMAEALETGSLFFEWIHQRKDGQKFPAEVMLSQVEVDGKQMLQALVRDITERKSLEGELKRLADTDPLTGAANRRNFLEKGANELLRSRRYCHPLSFLMMDVDHFKRINDTRGHAAGDKVLKALVTQSCRMLRETDLFGRLGGEEFAVILPETRIEDAHITAERLRRHLSELEIETDGGKVRLTVSIGLATLGDESDTLEAIMERADAALYKAKERGRNCVMHADLHGEVSK